MVHFTGFSVLQIFLACDTFCEEADWRVFETHFIFNVWPYGANLGAHKIRGCYFLCVFISFKGILRVPFQLFASLADYEPDNLPQPIRMPLSGLQRPSQAQLLV